MTSRFASVTVEQILSIFIDKQGGCSKKYKMVTNFGLTVFNDNFFNLSKLKISSQQKATIDCLHELSSSAKV